MVDELTNSFKEIQREIDTHRMFSVSDFTKTEINLKKNEEQRYEQQLANQMKKLKEEQQKMHKIVLEYELCLKGEKPKNSDYSDDENAFHIPTD